MVQAALGGFDLFADWGELFAAAADTYSDSDETDEEDLKV